MIDYSLFNPDDLEAKVTSLFPSCSLMQVSRPLNI